MPTVAPPDVPTGIDQKSGDFLRRLRTWAVQELDKRTADDEAQPQNLMLAKNATRPSSPQVFKFQVDQDGIASLAPVALGSSSPGPSVPLVNEAPPTGAYVRSGNAWTPAVPASGGAFTGPITAPSATLSGALSAASAAITGLITAAAATLTGALSAATLSLTTTTPATVIAFTTLPINAANDAAAATAGVPVGGVYRNGSILMVRAV